MNHFQIKIRMVLSRIVGIHLSIHRQIENQWNILIISKNSLLLEVNKLKWCLRAKHSYRSWEDRYVFSFINKSFNLVSSLRFWNHSTTGSDTFLFKVISLKLIFNYIIIQSWKQLLQPPWMQLHWLQHDRDTINLKCFWFATAGIKELLRNVEFYIYSNFRLPLNWCKNAKNVLRACKEEGESEKFNS